MRLSWTILTPILTVILLGATTGLAAGSGLRDGRFQAARDRYDKRDHRPNHVRAAELFGEIAHAHPSDLQVGIWCARTAYYCAHRFRDDNKDEMRRLARIGKTCGAQLLKHHANNHEARLWAMLAEFKSKAAESFIPSVGDAEHVLTMLEKMSKKHPKDYRVKMMLGSLYRELPGWPISRGDNKKALSIHENAARLAPTNAELLLELAGTYDAVGREDKARATYLKCIRKGTGEPELVWETGDARAWAKKMLKELD